MAQVTKAMQTQSDPSGRDVASDWDSNPSSPITHTPHRPSTVRHPRGEWVGQLREINPHLTPRTIMGAVRIELDSDILQVTVNATGFHRRAPLLVSLHAGRSCPEATADLNADGMIDAVESMAHGAGGILLPLTPQLQADGHPLTIQNSLFSDERGRLLYHQLGHIEQILSTLRSLPPRIARTRLAPDEFLLGRRVVIISGVLPDAPVPRRAASIAALPAHVTVPVACAALTSH